MTTSRDRSGGFTLLEVLIVVSITVLLVAFVVNLVVSTRSNQTYSFRMARATEANLELINLLSQELASSVKLFADDASGSDYLALLELDPLAAPIGTSALPDIDVDGIFEKETTSATKTGNALLFAQHAWTTEFECTSGNTYRVDVYRAVHYYLKKEAGGPQSGSNIGLNLCRFVSEPLADGDQVDAISDPDDHAEVLEHLHAQTPDTAGRTYDRVELVWRRNGDVASVGTVRQIEPLAWTLSDTPLSPRPPSWSWRRDMQRSSPGLLYYRHFSVASNFARKAWGVGRFGKISTMGDGFPHGFEVQCAGTSSGRKVLLHLTLVTTNRDGQQAHSDLRSVVFAQDV